MPCTTVHCYHPQTHAKQYGEAASYLAGRLGAWPGRRAQYVLCTLGCAARYPPDNGSAGEGVAVLLFQRGLDRRKGSRSASCSAWKPGSGRQAGASSSILRIDLLFSFLVLDSDAYFADKNKRASEQANGTRRTGQVRTGRGAAVGSCVTKFNHRGPKPMSFSDDGVSAVNCFVWQRTQRADGGSGRVDKGLRRYDREAVDRGLRRWTSAGTGSKMTRAQYNAQRME